MKRTFRILPLAVAVGVLIAAFGLGNTTTRSDASPRLANNILQHNLDVYLGRADLAPFHFPVSSGPLRTVLEATGNLPGLRSQGAGGQPKVRPSTNGCKKILKGQPGRPDNIRVTQECSLRRQAEEVVAVNPTDLNNLVAGQNDSRIG